MAWLVGFIEVGIEVILVIFGDFEFLSQCMDGTDSLVFASGYLFLNVNHAPLPGVKIYCNSTVLLYLFRYNLLFVHFCNLNIDYLSGKNAFTCNDPVML